MLQRLPAEQLSVPLLKLGEDEMSKGHDKGHKGQMSDREVMKLAVKLLITQE